MEKIREQLDKIDNLSLRERAITLGAIVVLIFIIWLTFFHDPLEDKKKSLQAQIEQQTAELVTLSTQSQVLTEKISNDPNTLNLRKRDRLNENLAASRQEILAVTRNLITPESMPEILRAILMQTKGLKLIKLNGLGKSPIISANIEDDEKSASGDKKNTDNEKRDNTEEFETAYKHGMQIVFEGNFLSTLAFIEKLEALNWQFFWHSIKFEVEEYPRSISSITLYTLSLNENWIGI